MKLNYNILWFEDNKNSFDTKKIIVEGIVEKFGFNFPEPQNEIDGENIDNINYDEYDLIIVDLNLAGTKGPALINKIRDKDVYTEVIFYSSSGENVVRKALSELAIDGAYCTGRDNDDFEEKVGKVIKTTIKKVQDLNNMRGLVMAETSDIDNTMFQIIENILGKKDVEISKSLALFIFENVHEKISAKKGHFDRYNKKQINKIIEDPLLFDSSERIKAVQFIIDSIDNEITLPHKKNNFSNSYTKIKEKRNLLAHGKEEIQNGIKILKRGNKEIKFTDDFCIEMRNEIKKHAKILAYLLGSIYL